MRTMKWIFILLSLVGMTVILSEPADAAKVRRFYITNGTFDGGSALDACNNGFHMALWEIYEISNLRYDQTLGINNTDSGSGPPTGFAGWIRTGYSSNPSGLAGHSNCFGYSLNTPSVFGTLVEIPANWEDVSATKVGLWNTGTNSCASHNHVWCVQNK
jgi:hypothetical protein